MFVAPHSKVVHIEAPVLLSGAVDMGHHPAAVEGAAHGGSPGGADGALEVLALRHGLLQAHQPPPHHVAAGHPDQTVLVEPDLRLPSLARWRRRGHFCKDQHHSSIEDCFLALPDISDFLRFFAPFFGLSEEVGASLDLIILEGT